MSDVDIPHFAFPFVVGNDGTFVCVEQDSEDDIVGCVATLVSTPRGSRLEMPEYGVDDQLFRQALDVQAIMDDITDWEPRAAVSINTQIDSVDKLVRHIAATVRNGGDVS